MKKRKDNDKKPAGKPNNYTHDSPNHSNNCQNCIVKSKENPTKMSVIEIITQCSQKQRTKDTATKAKEPIVNNLSRSARILSHYRIRFVSKNASHLMRMGHRHRHPKFTIFSLEFVYVLFRMYWALTADAEWTLMYKFPWTWKRCRTHVVACVLLLLHSIFGCLRSVLIIAYRIKDSIEARPVYFYLNQ